MGTDSGCPDQIVNAWEQMKQDKGLKHSKEGSGIPSSGLYRRRTSSNRLQQGEERLCSIQEPNGDIPISEQDK